MTPLLTVNLLRVLFVTFCATIGGIVGVAVQERALPGVFRWPRLSGCSWFWPIGCSGRFAPRLFLRHPRPPARLALCESAHRLGYPALSIRNHAVGHSPDRLLHLGYLGMMLAMRSQYRDEFSLIIPYVRFARETTQHRASRG